MNPERKTVVTSVRMSAALVERLDYVARNNDVGIRNRSEAVTLAVVAWLPAEEKRLTDLGLEPPKKAR